MLEEVRRDTKNVRGNPMPIRFCEPLPVEGRADVSRDSERLKTSTSATPAQLRLKFRGANRHLSQMLDAEPTDFTEP